MSEDDNDYLEGEEKKETPEKDYSHQDQEEDQDEAKEKRKAQQEEGNRQENLRLRNLLVEAEVAKAKNDGNSLLELHKKDPKLAKLVSENFAREKTEWWDYDSYLKGEKKWTPQADFEERYKIKRTEEIHSEALAKAEKLLWKIKDEELQKEAKVYFDKMSKWKKLTIEEAEEFAEMATLYVNKETIKSERFSKWLADLASSWVSASKKWKAEVEDQRVIRKGKRVLLDSNNQK